MFQMIDFFIEAFILKLKLNAYKSFFGFALLVLSLIISVLLQKKAVREYFKISLSAFRIALIFSIIISIVIIVDIYTS